MHTPSLVVRIPTRYLLLCLAALAAWGLLCARTGATDAPALQGPRDTDLYRAAITRVHAGEPYYDVMGHELRARGYPTASVFNWRLPTLTWLEARLPSLVWSRGLLSLLGLAVAGLWWWPRRHGPPMAVLLITAALVITLPLWVWVSPGAILLHDLWTGQLIALSLALRSRGGTAPGLAAGAAAVSLRVLALPFAALMAVMAWSERRRAECAAWVGVVAVGGLWLGWHAAHVWPRAGHDVVPGWLAWGQWCFVLMTTRVDLAWMLSPGWATALIVPVLLGGLWYATDPGLRRVAVTATAYLALFTVVGRPDNWYWGLLVAPLLPLGVIGWLTPPQTRPTSRRPRGSRPGAPHGEVERALG